MPALDEAVGPSGRWPSIWQCHHAQCRKCMLWDPRLGGRPSPELLLLPDQVFTGRSAWHGTGSPSCDPIRVRHGLPGRRRAGRRRAGRRVGLRFAHEGHAHRRMDKRHAIPPHPSAIRHRPWSAPIPRTHRRDDVAVRRDHPGHRLVDRLARAANRAPSHLGRHQGLPNHVAPPEQCPRTEQIFTRPTHDLNAGAGGFAHATPIVAWTAPG